MFLLKVNVSILAISVIEYIQYMGEEGEIQDNEIEMIRKTDM